MYTLYSIHTFRAALYVPTTSSLLLSPKSALQKFGMRASPKKESYGTGSSMSKVSTYKCIWVRLFI